MIAAASVGKEMWQESFMTSYPTVQPLSKVDNAGRSVTPQRGRGSLISGTSGPKDIDSRYMDRPDRRGLDSRDRKGATTTRATHRH